MDDNPAGFAPPPAGRRRIYLMRHGSVTYFAPDGRPYPAAAVPLNEQGRLQARAAGRAFLEAGVRFDRVIVSGLPRTRETAALVLAETGQLIESEVWPDLAELRGGRLSAIPDERLREAFVGAFEGEVDESRTFLGGETIGALLDRVHPQIERLRALADWDCALLVLHGGVNRAIVSHALTGRRAFLGALAQTAGAINVLDVGQRPGDWVVRLLNYSPPAPLQTSSRATTMETLYEQYIALRKT